MDRFGRRNVAVELTTQLAPTDDEDNDALAELAAELGLALVATTGAHYATPREAGSAPRWPRCGRGAAWTRPTRTCRPGPGAHLRSGAEMAALFARYPDGGARRPPPSARSARSTCTWSRRTCRPTTCRPATTRTPGCRELTMRGAARRYGSPDERPDAYAQIEKELRIIEELDFPGYFLIVYDIVQFCHEHQIMCQGRGSAANSAVCYALGITAVDAVSYQLLFERFLAPERDGPPDIDIDIESDRREEVIQHVFDTYGRTHAAQVANVNTFRPRMAVRDMAKALGHSPGQQDAYSKQLDGWSPLAAQLQDDARQCPPDVLELAGQIQDYPRHLGIHSGGMVICDRPVAQVCPVEWARMENRSVLQWDKDDCAAMGLVKFDLLGLGMLSALHYAVDLVREHEGVEVDFAKLDLEEPAVYEMLQRADSVGVFQVESRAQMATLPRLQAAHLLRPGGGGGADPARPDPGWVGAPVHPAPQRVGAGHLRPPGHEAVARQDAGHPAVPGAADATRGGRRGVRRGRGRPAAPGDGRQAVHPRRWRS